jgi:cytochrome c oxidase cbb3-type subunit 3
VTDTHWKQIVAILAIVALAACSQEARTLASDQPQTPPKGADDPRTSRYQDNVYQVSQGARYFIWYGCAQCHGPEETGALDLDDHQWRHGDAVNQVYGFIARAHPGAQAGYGRSIPVEQLWQITAYVRDLPKKDPTKIRREALDGKAEPQGASWTEPLR